jgi:hypothetical protein
MWRCVFEANHSTCIGQMRNEAGGFDRALESAMAEANPTAVRRAERAAMRSNRISIGARVRLQATHGRQRFLYPRALVPPAKGRSAATRGESASLCLTPHALAVESARCSDPRSGSANLEIADCRPDLWTRRRTRLLLPLRAFSHALERQFDPRLGSSIGAPDLRQASRLPCRSHSHRGSRHRSRDLQ